MKLSGSLKISILNMPFMSPKAGLSRRNFIGFMLCAGISGLFSKSVFAAIGELATTERSLSLYNPHTKDSFNGVYWRKGKYVTDALKNINHIMRDFRAHDIKQIDTHLLDLLSAISIKLKPEKPFHVISGYRSPETNAKLRKRGKGAAKNSYHIQGKAVDIRLPGYRTSVLRRTAHNLKGGGVGYYPHQRFVHIDVGPIRYWKGT
jgi:uncharacterized protein YcbK (DUF882 family)